jgi:hypothetical protein
MIARWLVAGAVAWAAAGTAAADRAPAVGRLERRFAPPPAKPVVVEVTVGEVAVRAWARAELVATVEPHVARGADVSRLALAIEETDDEVRVVARQAGAPDRALAARVSIRAPADTVVRSIEVLDGRVTLEGLRGTVSATVKQGDIEGVRLAGVVRLETGLGSVRLREAELLPKGLLRLRAFNGDVVLGLARPPADARVLALSFNGRVVSELPLRMTEGFGPTFGEATLGAGAPVISLDAVYGDVTIRLERREP